MIPAALNHTLGGALLNAKGVLREQLEQIVIILTFPKPERCV